MLLAEEPLCENDYDGPSPSLAPSLLSREIMQTKKGLFIGAFYFSSFFTLTSRQMMAPSSGRQPEPEPGGSAWPPAGVEQRCEKEETPRNNLDMWTSEELNDVAVRCDDVTKSF